MENRIKLIELAPGIQAVCVKDKMKVKRVAPRKGWEVKPIIGCIIYIDHQIREQYVDLANRFVCNSEKERDEKFEALTVGQLIPMYNKATQDKMLGLPVIALQTEKGKEVPIAVLGDKAAEN